MKILLLGATGATGQQLLMQALEQQHEVTALVRNPSKLLLSHNKLTVVKGDVLDRNVLSKALEAKEAVISALGVGKTLKSSHLIDKAIGTLIPAMQATGVNRVIFLSAFGVGETFRQANFLQKIIFRLLLKNIFSDKAKGEEQFRNSTLAWTLVYPVFLTNGPRTGKYQVGEKLPMKVIPTISRADVADFMLKQLTTDEFLRKSPLIMG